MKKVVLVEDDISLHRLISAWLQPYGYQTIGFSDGESLIGAWDSLQPVHFLILDRKLPGMSGLSLMKEMSKNYDLSTVPIIFCSGFANENDAAEALFAGADDYIVKPIKKTTLLARISAVTRRYSTAGSSHKVDLTLVPGRLCLGTKSVKLSSKEFSVVSLLLRSKGGIVSRKSLLEAAYPNANHASLDLLISRLRRKIDILTGRSDLLVTHYGQGYSLASLD